MAPALGRDFTQADDGGQIGYVALISYDLWQRRFGGDPEAIGKTVRLDDDPITIIGVMPRGFRHPIESSASPMELVGADRHSTDPDTNVHEHRGRSGSSTSSARLKPGQRWTSVRRSSSR